MTDKVMSGQSQEFCVRWNSHLGSLGAAFPQLLAGQRFVDVTLACEGHQLHCHRLVLAACSTYFESILAENPCKHPVIILPRDIKLWEIQALIDFMYKGEVNVTQAGLPNLLKCAESLQIRGLHGSDAALNLKQLKQMSKSTTSTTSSSNTNDNLDEDNSSNASASTSALNANEMNQSSTMTSLTPNGAHTSLSHTKSTNDPQNALQLSCEKLSVGGDSFMTESMDDTSIKYEPFESFNKADPDAGIDDESYAAGDDSADNDDNMCQINLDGHNSSYKRVRRSEALLAQAAKCVSKGQTFQTVSNMFSIPVSTIRFYMARKGILPKRKRGRGSSGATMGGSLMSNALSQMKRSVSPTEPPFQFLNYKLPTQKPNLI